MKLSELILGLEECRVVGPADIQVCELAVHTASVVPGACFVAIRGTLADGHDYVADAVAKGAVAVVTEKSVNVPPNVAGVIVKDSPAAAAIIASRFFKEPSKSMTLVGVTGTNGKTTTTYLLEAIFSAAGRKAGVIGTVEYRFLGKREPALHTTPQSIDLQRLLGRMRDLGCDLCAMEVSSHALVQGRVLRCHFDCGVFTNLSPEHLDYHGEMEVYFAAKAILFEGLLASSVKKDRFAVISGEDIYGRELIKRCPVDVVTYGFSEDSQVRGIDLSFDEHGLVMKVATPSGHFDCISCLRGRFNAQNILGAVAVATRFRIPNEVIREAISNMGVVPGRFEVVPNNKGVLALVDYAHTPDALENVLSNARHFAKAKGARVIVVFGCGGDRDRLKRPLMGRAAARFAEVVIVTSDNPRGEEPKAIIDEIMPGVMEYALPLKNGKGYEVIEDRRAAIKRAVAVSKLGDVIVVAGKGHENYQLFGARKLPFNDREVLEEFLR